MGLSGNAYPTNRLGHEPMRYSTKVPMQHRVRPCDLPKVRYSLKANAVLTVMSEVSSKAIGRTLLVEGYVIKPELYHAGDEDGTLEDYTALESVHQILD